jgi:hypothetical protein
LGVRWQADFGLKKVPIDEYASRSRLQVLFERDRRFPFFKGKIRDEKPRAKLGRMWRAPFIVMSKSLSQIASRSYIMAALDETAISVSKRNTSELACQP